MVPWASVSSKNLVAAGEDGDSMVPRASQSQTNLLASQPVPAGAAEPGSAFESGPSRKNPLAGQSSGDFSKLDDTSARDDEEDSKSRRV